jgi:hypothetical protein
MKRRSVVPLLAVAAAAVAIALIVCFSGATPPANASRSALAGATNESTATATPCPTDTAPDIFHGGCGTVTPTPTSQHPYPCGVTPGPPTATNTPGGPTATAAPTGTPCPAPAPEPEIILTVNGSPGWVNVVQGTSPPVAWVLSNRGPGTISATIDDQLFDGLDSECQLDPGESCTMSTNVTFDTVTQIVDTVTVKAWAGPATVSYASASVRITVAPLGDFNCDGATDALDASWILQLSAGIILQISNTCYSDVNGDGDVNAVDALLILQFDAGLVPHFV